MDTESLITQMEATAEAIRALTAGISDKAATWSPDPDGWSLLDVINHLTYEEADDFRARLDLVLHSPEEALPPGDPARGATDESRRRGLALACDGFLEARQKSLSWLRALQAPDWDQAVETPFGRLRAGDILASWAAHDLLHLRQLIELRYHYLAQAVEPYSVGYAGEWRQEP